MLRFRCDHVANTLSVTTNRDRASPLLTGSPTEQRLTALHSRSPPQRTYGLLQTRPRGSFAAQPAALKPPGQFRAAPLPHRCRVPSVRAPGQDFHLRSQHPYSAHQGSALRAFAFRRPRRVPLRATALGNFRDQLWGGFRDRRHLQQFVNQSSWDSVPMRRALARRMSRELAPEAWVIDDTGFPKFGKKSVGVARQHSGALGKIGNCQIGVSINAATDEASCPLDWRLFIPEESGSAHGDPARAYRLRGLRARSA